MDANLRGGVVDGAAKHEGDPPPPFLRANRFLDIQYARFTGTKA